ncbi:MAG: YicC family protein [Rhodobacteraceae bacterium]|nr:YicC family protein [Paracoccaceae bacterium]
MIMSMTGFAAARGALGAYSWAWELRGVNAKGLDLRMRVPDWLDGLETALRTELTASVKRGSLTLSLRVQRGDDGAGLRLNGAALDVVLEALAETERRAEDRGLVMEPSRAADVLALRGVWDSAAAEDDTAPLLAALKAEFPDVLADFLAMRKSEGAALQKVLLDQLGRVGDLAARAAVLAEARKPVVAETLKANLARIMEGAEAADPDRVAQELALLAVKADVTEEIDRLRTHVEATRTLVDKGGVVGRKLDFLMQEFNREANTLCAKSQSADLTAVGLELKAVIDQIREQVQNVE